MGRYTIFFLGLMLLNSLKAASQLNLKQPVDTVEKKITLKLLPQNFYNHNLGYFCKKEVQLQKVIRLPLFIRLGSKDYVDWMEQKPNAVKRF